MFSVLHDVFHFITSISTTLDEVKPMPRSLRDEILFVRLLSLLAGADLAAPFSATMSVSDASEQGGVSARSQFFMPPVETDSSFN